MRPAPIAALLVLAGDTSLPKVDGAFRQRRRGTSEPRNAERTTGGRSGGSEPKRVPIRITVSYRRSDSPYAARGIRARFAEHFGKENVFMDIDSIALGVDYRKPIAEALARSDVVAVVIGPKWYGQREGAKPRLFDSNDPVRYEIAAALSSERILVIPLLVDGATMPSEEALPENLKELAYRNATAIDSGRDFETHVDRVIRSIEYWQHAEGENEKISVAADERELPQGAPEAEWLRFTAEAERARLAAIIDDQRVGPEGSKPTQPAFEDRAPRRRATEASRTSWWVFLVRGCLAMIVVLPILWMEDPPAGYRIAVFGAFALADGVMTLIQGLPVGHSGQDKWRLTVAQGVVGIVAGLIGIQVALVLHDVATATPAHLIAIWALVTGILEISTAVRLRRSLPNEFVFLVTHGALSVALGMKFAVDPQSFHSFGIYALVSGLGLIIAFLLRIFKTQVSVA
jgi:uncharacterized membrane protein HdeD (DUF308 family)